MPVESVILLPFNEYKRLLAIEKRMLEQRAHSEKHASKAVPVSDPEDGAAHLSGQGALLTSSNLSSQVPGLQDNIRQSIPVPIDTSSLPPPNVPVYFTSRVHQNPELVLQQVQMEKHLKAPSGLPLNDPSGAADPTLGPGEAPIHPFHVPKKSRADTEEEQKEVDNWYFVGLDFESESD